MPDLDRLGMGDAEVCWSDVVNALTKRVYDIAGNLAQYGIVVYINDQRISVANFKDYCALYNVG